MPLRSLGATVYQAVVLGLVLLALVLFAWGQLKDFRSGTWRDRAHDASAAAHTAQANADSADAGAANASATRTEIAAGTLTVRVETEQSAHRIESYAHRTVPTADLAPVDPDVLLELEAAEGRTRAAADRLQRAHPR